MTWDSGITYNDGVSRPGYKEELEQFARAILYDEPCHADLEDGWKAMLVLDAIEESLQEGKPAAVPAT
jgi:predicted dehydrogenase